MKLNAIHCTMAAVVSGRGQTHNDRYQLCSYMYCGAHILLFEPTRSIALKVLKLWKTLCDKYTSIKCAPHSLTYSGAVIDF